MRKDERSCTDQWRESLAWLRQGQVQVAEVTCVVKWSAESQVHPVILS